MEEQGKVYRKMKAEESKFSTENDLKTDTQLTSYLSRVERGKKKLS